MITGPLLRAADRFRVLPLRRLRLEDDERFPRIPVRVNFRFLIQQPS